MIRIAYHDIYAYPLPEGHRFPMDKYPLLKMQLLHENIFEESHFFMPDALDDDQLLLTHTKEYLDKLHHQSLTVKEVRAIGFPMSPLLVERGKHIAMGTYQSAIFALTHGISLNTAGGTHHSFADHGEGFCIFNDIAIAANLLIHRHNIHKILIIDLDVHQGNGTAKIFENEAKVVTLSVHGEKNYPLRKEKSDIDIGLGDGIRDNEYIQCISKLLPIVIEQHKPQMIFYQSGVDVLASDKLGRLNLSMQGCKHRDEIVIGLAHHYQIPIAISMGGGYSHRLSDIINAHANTYRVAKYYE